MKAEQQPDQNMSEMANTDSVESNKPLDDKAERQRVAEINARYAEAKRQKNLENYTAQKEVVSLDADLQEKFATQEKQIEELRIRGRDREANNLEQKSHEEAARIGKEYADASKEVLPSFPMKALKAKEKPIQLDTESDKKEFSKSFYESETIEGVDESKIDTNLLRKISLDLQQDGKVYEFTEHSTKQTPDGPESQQDVYHLIPYEGNSASNEDDKAKVYVGFAKDHSGRYLKVISLDAKSIDGKKYSLKELEPAQPNLETESDEEKEPYNIVSLEMGKEVLTHDLDSKIDLESITSEQIEEVNKKLSQDWTEIRNFLTAELNTAERQQGKFSELKDDLLNLIREYKANDPDQPASPYTLHNGDLSEYKNSILHAREKALKKIEKFVDHFQKDGELLKQLADKATTEKTSIEGVKKDADAMAEDLKKKIDLKQKQGHLAFEGQINSSILNIETLHTPKTTQDQLDEALFFHKDRLAQIVALEDGTWKPSRRRQE